LHKNPKQKPLHDAQVPGREILSAEVVSNTRKISMGKVSRKKAIRSAPLKGYLPDEQISFNIRRLSAPRNPFLRTITLFPGEVRPVIVPGLDPGKETDLLAELKRFQNWKKVEVNGYRVPPLLFSFLWRFHGGAGRPPLGFQSMAPFPPKIAKMIESAYKQYRARLANSLAPGQVFLIPDAEVTFNRPGRYRQIYARPVLVASAGSDQVLFIPFSRKIERLRPDLDILFDPSDKSGQLTAAARPAVENFPYLIFPERTALMVSAAQPMARSQFLEAALVSRGAVRREVLALVNDRLKRG
jgi:hypothetical protein